MQTQEELGGVNPHVPSFNDLEKSSNEYLQLQQTVEAYSKELGAVKKENAHLRERFDAFAEMVQQEQISLKREIIALRRENEFLRCQIGCTTVLEDEEQGVHKTRVRSSSENMSMSLAAESDDRFLSVYSGGGFSLGLGGLDLGGVKAARQAADSTDSTTATAQIPDCPGFGGIPGGCGGGLLHSRSVGASLPPDGRDRIDSTSLSVALEGDRRLSPSASNGAPKSTHYSPVPTAVEASQTEEKEREREEKSNRSPSGSETGAMSPPRLRAWSDDFVALAKKAERAYRAETEGFDSWMAIASGGSGVQKGVQKEVSSSSSSGPLVSVSAGDRLRRPHIGGGAVGVELLEQDDLVVPVDAFNSATSVGVGVQPCPPAAAADVNAMPSEQSGGGEQMVGLGQTVHGVSPLSPEREGESSSRSQAVEGVLGGASSPSHVQAIPKAVPSAAAEERVTEPPPGLGGVQHGGTRMPLGGKEPFLAPAATGGNGAQPLAPDACGSLGADPGGDGGKCKILWRVGNVTQ
eukprot:Cvel_23543.t1-p1 / transcript=Cvel_23543.t1 / gene=Cvel_23543 / organism=Chromera_velia_CCMP2878 / gene_product=hypothetical protein / transcript_product=hypothetical protein / location=Cvel_scaffold2437:26081-28304(+) / protein_length=520 / sequence_SO=supercontig / SO=protein_coding / is_pseudo=false